MLPYLIIVFFAVLEGEIYYSKVCADAMMGTRSWVGVWCAGALGGAIGDQFWFYLLRGRIHWLDRFKRLARYRDAVSDRVHANEGTMILAGRFLPGLRTAIPIACAYACVRPLKFTTLNLVSAFAWAGAIMLFVKLGSTTLGAFGLNAWWSPLVPAVLVVIFFRWLSRPRRKPTPTGDLST
jgi:membrane protein DedA with SNARE-associated domain